VGVWRGGGRHFAGAAAGGMEVLFSSEYEGAVTGKRSMPVRIVCVPAYHTNMYVAPAVNCGKCDVASEEVGWKV
jgi:hypothetical protein